MEKPGHFQAKTRRRKAPRAAKIAPAELKRIAVHECGHAIVTYLTGSLMGYRPCDALDSVVVYAKDARPIFSYCGISCAAAGACRPRATRQLSLATRLKAEVAIFAAGMAAEAKYFGEDFDAEIFCESGQPDARWFIAWCAFADLDWEIMPLLTVAIADLKRLMERSDIWNAVLALTKELEKHRKLDGAAVATIINKTLPKAPRIAQAFSRRVAAYPTLSVPWKLRIVMGIRAMCQRFQRKQTS